LTLSEWFIHYRSVAMHADLSLADWGDPRVFGRGRWADVVDAGRGRVARRYRDPSLTATYEAEVMRHMRAHGVPVPEVFAVDGPTLVMQRVDGPTMLTDLARRPWMLRSHAGTLARLHARVHAVPPADWFRRAHEDGDATVHLDLHPDNVILGADGPFIIDWQAAGLGSARMDVALAFTIITTSVVPGAWWQRTAAAFGQNAFGRLFAARCEERLASSDLEGALRARLNDPALLPPERLRIEASLARFRATTARPRKTLA